MKSILKRIFFDINLFSLFLIISPYFWFNSASIFNSLFFSYKRLLIFLGIILVLECLIKIYFKRKSDKNYFLSLIAVIFISIFYGYYYILIIQKSLFILFSAADRNLIIIIVLLTLFFLYFIILQISSFKFINIFFLIFSIISLSNSILNSGKTQKFSSKVQNEVKFKSKNRKLQKPIILIILDEYNSPDGLFKVTKDKSIYEFSKYLKKKQWIVRNSSFSYETSTIHSLSSMFNYNISRQVGFKQSNVERLAEFKLKRSKLYFDFFRNNTKIVNFGIFDFGKLEPFTRLYYYPKSFFELFFANSIYHVLRIPLINLGKNNRTLGYYPMEEHNKYLLNHFVDSVSKIKNNNTFIYVHLYMPHSPIIYQPEIKLLPNNFNNYITYWKFTNSKIEETVKKLMSNGKFRIIITGDHGFKSDKRLNPNYTFSAFYGFDKSRLNFVKSVQDFGFLFEN